MERKRCWSLYEEDSSQMTDFCKSLFPARRIASPPSQVWSGAQEHSHFSGVVQIFGKGSMGPGFGCPQKGTAEGVVTTPGWPHEIQKIVIWLGGICHQELSIPTLKDGV